VGIESIVTQAKVKTPLAAVAVPAFSTNNLKLKA